MTAAVVLKILGSLFVLVLIASICIYVAKNWRKVLLWLSALAGFVLLFGLNFELARILNENEFACGPFVFFGLGTFSLLGFIVTLLFPIIKIDFNSPSVRDDYGPSSKSDLESRQLEAINAQIQGRPCVYPIK